MNPIAKYMLLCMMLCHGFVWAQRAANPMADPFGTAAASTQVAPAARSTAASAETAEASMSAMIQSARAAIPRTLRVLLISANGTGLLSSSEVGSASIPVADGRTVRIGDAEFIASIGRDHIKLLLPGGRLAWQGSLAGVTSVSLVPDTSQLKYVPPMSAGVDPGLERSISGRAAASKTKPAEGR